MSSLLRTVRFFLAMITIVKLKSGGFARMIAMWMNMLVVIKASRLDNQRDARRVGGSEELHNAVPVRWWCEGSHVGGVYGCVGVMIAQAHECAHE